MKTRDYCIQHDNPSLFLKLIVVRKKFTITDIRYAMLNM